MPLNNDITYFESFGVEHIPKEIKRFIGNKNMQKILLKYKHIVMCEYFCTGFIDFMLEDKNLTGFANLFSPNIFRK